MHMERMIVLQSDVDDETPENLAEFQRLALKQGANDCVLTPLVMKKGRPGVRVEILTRKESLPFFQELLIRQTTTIGFRVLEVERYSLERREVRVEMEGCGIRCKAVYYEGQLLRFKPEHEDCLEAARALDVPLCSIKERAKEEAAKLLNS
ncbi:MAG: nickel insertion protein [Candidatus Sumerlaeia bacterium]|nr:nickel insertion protein [Candidatus Sumerlaeia bacterium]